MSLPDTPGKRPRMKAWRGWAMVGPDNRLVTIHGGPMVYRTKRDALLDKEDRDTARRVVILEVTDE